MMKRMEIIQREQEEQILSSVSKNVLSKRNTLVGVLNVAIKEPLQKFCLKIIEFNECIIQM